MAAALAASLPAPVLPQADAQPQVTKVPQRLEGVVDPEALRNVESVSLNALVCVLLRPFEFRDHIVLEKCWGRSPAKLRQMSLTFRSSSRC
jgi:hypothetical protein